MFCLSDIYIDMSILTLSEVSVRNGALSWTHILHFALF